MVEYSDDAISALAGHREWIAQESGAKRAADQMELIIEACEMLDRNPNVGRRYFGNVRFFPKGTWVILYGPAKKAKTGIEVREIFDGRQDWQSKLR